MISEAGLNLIAEFEGFSPTPYNDPVGHCTVGYGELLHLGPCTPEDMARPPLTEAEGRDQLVQKVKPYADAVTALSRPLNANEHAALTSLCYNIGQGGYANSGVRRAVNDGGDVCGELLKIVHGTDGVAYPGLVRRRKAECSLFHESVAEEEEDDMPFLAWVPQQQATYLIGPQGAKYIGSQQLSDELVRLFGPIKVALSNDALDAIGVRT